MSPPSCSHPFSLPPAQSASLSALVPGLLPLQSLRPSGRALAHLCPHLLPSCPCCPIPSCLLCLNKMVPSLFLRMARIQPPLLCQASVGSSLHSFLWLEVAPGPSDAPPCPPQDDTHTMASALSLICWLPSQCFWPRPLQAGYLQGWLSSRPVVISTGCTTGTIRPIAPLNKLITLETCSFSLAPQVRSCPAFPPLLSPHLRAPFPIFHLAPHSGDRVLPLCPQLSVGFCSPLFSASPA